MFTFVEGFHVKTLQTSILSPPIIGLHSSIISYLSFGKGVNVVVKVGVNFVEESCIPEVKQYIREVVSKVAEKLKKRGYEVQPIDLNVVEGAVVLQNREACAATNPDVKPVKQIYNCLCWERFSENAKIFSVAHELVHAYGIKDENIANEIALEVVRET
jgi:hypothetical protein